MDNVTPKRQRRVLVKHKGTRSMNCVEIVAVIVCATIAISFFGAFVFIILKPCANDSMCARSNKCSLDYCSHGFCHHDWIEGCCMVDEDCEEVDCYDNICDRGTCRLKQKMNGTLCDDHSLCTANDRCVDGQCKGNLLNCNVNQCTESSCDKTLGCQYVSKDDGTPCDDNNLCTANDVCASGLCASGISKDCTHLDTVCTVGVCDVISGNCVSANRVDGTPCDDGASCSINDQCVAGVCAGTLNKCEDNNPCTINQCVSPIGCMIQYQYDLNNTCQPGCVDSSSCPEEFICHDGTCINVPTDSMLDIRFLDYTIENCTNHQHRLILSFTLDAPQVSVAATDYFQIVDTLGLSTATPQPLGFIDEVVNLNSAILPNNNTRTAFALATQCQTVDSTNCATIFMNREYDFDAKIMMCENVSPNVNCIDPNVHAQAHVPISISDCAKFPQMMILTVYGQATAYFLNDVFTGVGIIDIEKHPEERLFITLNTTVLHNPHFVSHNLHIVACEPKQNHIYSDCVTGNANNCPVVGCFGWDEINSFDPPIVSEFNIMQSGYFTALAESILKVDGAYDNSVYTSPHTIRCSSTKKYSWTKPGDDGFSIQPEYFKPESFGTRTIVFDIIYRVTACENTLGSTETHQLSTVIFK